MTLFSLSKYLNDGDLDVFQISVAEQRVFLDSLPEPQSDVERSLNQFRCQGFFNRKTRKALIFNVVSVITLPFLITFFLFKAFFVSKTKSINYIMEDNGMPEIIPLSLQKEFNLIPIVIKPMLLQWTDLKFLKRLFSVFFGHPFYLLKGLANLAQYSYIRKKYSPRLIVRAEEDSASSSLLTAYCNSFGIMHFNVMHGEKLFNIRDSFFHFNRCYVWDNHYKELFISMRAETNQFIIELPPSLIINVEQYKNHQSYAKYKYYLQSFSEEELLGIISSLPVPLNDSSKIKFRPHPRYSDLGFLYKHVPKNFIEDPSEVSILESISNLDYAIGSFTTVLLQAYYNGKIVILDDVTFLGQYNKLKEMQYLLIEKEIPVLSKWSDN